MSQSRLWKIVSRGQVLITMSSEEDFMLHRGKAVHKGLWTALFCNNLY